MTILSLITVIVIVSFTNFEMTDAQKAAVQPEKFMFVEKITTTALFEFRDGTELVPIQIFSQTGGFGTTTLSQAIEKTQLTSSEVTGRSKPSFTMEKILGGTPYLYEAADEAQKYALNAGFEYPYKSFDVTVFLAADGDVLRSFEYHDCQVKSYGVVTRADNEEGYTGKGFAIVDQFTFECVGYKPLNPAMDKLKFVEKAKTISSSDLRSTDSWGPNFTTKK